MNFFNCAQLFNRLETISSRLEITQQLAAFFKELNPDELSIICNLCLGQLHPVYVGTQFAIADKMMVRAIARHTGHGEVAIQDDLNKLGDLGAVVASYEWKARQELSIEDVYKKLCALEQLSGSGSQEKKIELLVELLHALSPDEAKFVVRIVLGKLRLGFSDMTLVDALSWMLAGNKSLHGEIEDAYNRCADLGHIAFLLKKEGMAAEVSEQGASRSREGDVSETRRLASKALASIDITVGIPIRPAAAERLPSAADVIAKLGPCIAQPKLDGFRLQIHIDKTVSPHKIHFYSRNLQDMSAMFPDLLKAIDTVDIKTIICEGEAIGYDPHTGAFLPFQETVKRKRKHGIADAAKEMPLKVFLFDLLYYNGTSYLDKTHAERRATLSKIMRHAHGSTVQLIDEKPVNTVQELQHYFDEMIESGLEGLVVKRPDAVYQPGKRNFNWIKLKRHAEGNLEDTLDCVILGYYAGQGKRAEFGIGAILAGVYNKKEDRFETIARIGTGFSDEQWREVKKKCDAIKVDHQPNSVVCAKNLVPDLWVSPEIVCFVFADEITVSPTHTAGKTDKNLGYALRFPRFMGYRPDKGAYEATTTEEVVGMYKDQYHQR
jgi:DNA ligase-1